MSMSDIWYSVTNIPTHALLATSDPIVQIYLTNFGIQLQVHEWVYLSTSVQNDGRNDFVAKGGIFFEQNCFEVEM